MYWEILRPEWSISETEQIYAKGKKQWERAVDPCHCLLLSGESLATLASLEEADKYQEGVAFHTSLADGTAAMDNGSGGF